MRPKVSIIVPIYNVEKYLDRCMQSLINQTLQDIEIIMVDDGSPDNCPRMCDEYAAKDKRIKVIHKQNAGLGMARNSGLEIATGEYVTFVDSDDFIDLKTCEVIYKKAMENDLDICYYEHCRYTTNGKIIYKPICDRELYFTTKEEVNYFLLNIIGLSPTSNTLGLKKKFSMSVCMAFYKLDKLQSSGVRFVSERTIAAEDLVFHIDYLPMVHRIAYTPQMLYYYYVNINSISTTWHSNQYDKMILLLAYVKKKLESLFLYYEYEGNFCSLILWAYKIFVRFISIDNSLPVVNRKKKLQKLFDDNLLKDLYKSKYISRYPVRERLFIGCMKYKFTYPLIVLYNMKYK